MSLTRHFTAEDVRGLPDDGNRYETVHGELLVTPAPGGFHQLIVTDLLLTLGTYLKANGIRGLLASPADISFDEDTLVQPDLFVADVAEFLPTGKWSDIRTLHLAIEVLSPSTARADRGVKRRLYQEQRIAEYWIVDIDQKQIEVWTPDALAPEVQSDRIVWQHPALDVECAVGVAGLFVWG
ncbi:MAG TPA: Uma2 family endonuclease [Gemmatimonadales bacterium]|nr:Uma2 family endonuclease [Gemmatimonadales bacterium]